MPIHRLNEQPTRRAVLQDLTCDSDGCIDQYIDGQNIEATLPIHEIKINEPYLIGFFIVFLANSVSDSSFLSRNASSAFSFKRS